MVSTRPLTSKSSGPCTNPLVTVPSAPIRISKTVTFTFHRVFFFGSLAKFQVLIVFFLIFIFRFCSVVCRDSNDHNSGSSFFFFSLTITRFGRLAEIIWFVCISKSQRNLCVLFIIIIIIISCSSSCCNL